MPDISESSHGQHSGKEVLKWTVEFPGKLKAVIMNYGATLMDLQVPDRKGVLRSIVLGYDKLEDYRKDNRYFGATIGRFANRIANGKFHLNDHDYSIHTNEGSQTLHGGPVGYDKKVWSPIAVRVAEDHAVLSFTYHSPDNDQGFPGDMQVTVSYTLYEDRVEIDYEAKTKHDTVINLTHHSYFNLSGDQTSSITNHVLFLDANHYLPVDKDGIPKNGTNEVKQSPFDFTEPRLIGSTIDHPSLERTNGYDHCWVLNTPDPETVSARLYHPDSGRQMEVLTSEPGIQFFSGNFPPEENLYEGGRHFGRHSGLCLETQHFPDSPNRPDFPSTTLSPTDTFQSKTVYRFSVVDQEG